jgi:hypothetical protein
MYIFGIWVFEVEELTTTDHQKSRLLTWLGYFGLRQQIPTKQSSFMTVQNKFFRQILVLKVNDTFMHVPNNLFCQILVLKVNDIIYECPKQFVLSNSSLKSK